MDTALKTTAAATPHAPLDEIGRDRGTLTPQERTGIFTAVENFCESRGATLQVLGPREANRYLVVVSMIHYIPGKISQSLASAIDRSKGFANSAALHLTESADIRTLSCDGLTPERGAEMNNRLNQYRSTNRMARKLGANQENTHIVETLISRFSFLQSIINNPALQLVGFEDKRYLRDFGFKAKDEEDFINSLIFRDNQIVTRFMKGTEPCTLTMMGSSHTFEEAVKLWNDAHQGNTVCVLRMIHDGLEISRQGASEQGRNLLLDKSLATSDKPPLTSLQVMKKKKK